MPAAPILVRIRRLDHARDLPLPSRQTDGSAGLDLRAAIDGAIEIAPGRIAMVPCGFAMQLPPDHEAQVRPRSGLASRHGITLVNGVGTVDSDYRGEVVVPLINLGGRPFRVARGDRIAQMIIAPVPPVTLVEVAALDDTPRGHGGFGHTGVGDVARP